MSGLELGAMLLGTAEVVGAVGAPSLGIVGGTSIAATSGLIGYGGGLTLSGLGTIAQAGSLLYSGIASGSASDADAKAGMEAALATEDAAARNAFATERKNRAEAEQLAKAQQQAKSRRAVAQGASGVEMAGSPIAVESGAAWQDEYNLTQMQQTGELEVSNIYYDAAAKAKKLRQQSALDSYMGTSNRIGGALAAGGSLLTRGAKIYGA